MTPKTPLRFMILAAFRESAKDMGDPAMIDVGARLWWAMSYPRTKGHMASAEDFALLKEFENR